MSTDDLPDQLRTLTSRISAACTATNRPTDAVSILLATKALSTERTLAAVHAGGTLLGESRVQEITAKGPALAALRAEREADGKPVPRVHLIGHLQSNKINAVLPWVDCIESIDSLRIASRVAVRAVEAGRTLDVFVQVNVSGEESKFGVSPEQAPELAEQVAALDGVRLRGFMTIGANSPDVGLVRASYARLRQIRDAVVSSGAPGTSGATDLSMGMSASLEAAIAEGATIVRIGRSVFGERPH